MSDLTPTRDSTEYINWVRGEFGVTTLITDDTTLKQLLENSIRYWNTHSAHKISAMVNSSGTGSVQLPVAFKSVATVYPNRQASAFWSDHPLLALTGVGVMNAQTTDLIMMTEGFKDFRIYAGTAFSWSFQRSGSKTTGGYLFYKNIPSGASSLHVVGARQILPSEDVADIADEHIEGWLLRYFKALVKQTEGNTLRKAGTIKLENDGQQIYQEGREEMIELQEQLVSDGRWFAFARRS